MSKNISKGSIPMIYGKRAFSFSKGKEGEVFVEGNNGLGYKATYSLINRGDGIRCAWCEKRNPTEKHLKNHECNQP